MNNKNAELFVNQIIAKVEKNKELILQVEQNIWKNPEIGYKEWKTTKYLQRIFEELGYEVKPAGDIPGFTAEISTGRPGPTIAIIAELDSLLCPEHPEADRETGAIHACGHHAQSAYLVGCAAAFAMPGALDGLCGSIRFMSVPAEETIDLEFRNSLIEKGTIHYVAGKVEFLYRGLFDGVDMVLFTHVLPNKEKPFAIDEGSDGCITKHFEYCGKHPMRDLRRMRGSIRCMRHPWVCRRAILCGRHLRRRIIFVFIQSLPTGAWRQMRSPG